MQSWSRVSQLVKCAFGYRSQIRVGLIHIWNTLSIWDTQRISNTLSISNTSRPTRQMRIWISQICVWWVGPLTKCASEYLKCAFEELVASRGWHGNNYRGKPAVTTVIPRVWGRQIDILPFSRGDGDSMIGITAVMGIKILLLPR